jgi:hypothetical protein
MAIDTEANASSTQGMPVFTGRYRSIVTDKATYVLRSGPAKLAQVIVWDAGTTWTLDFYDETSGSGSKVWAWVSATGLGVYALQIPCATGLTVVSGGTTAGGCTIVWD